MIRVLQRLKPYYNPPTLTTLSITEGFIVYFKVALLSGLVLSSPWVFYQVWAFIAAGLYPHEKRLVHYYLPFSLALFLVGVFMCQIFVIPKAIEALLWFNEWLGFEPELRLSDWLGFAIMMPVVFGLSFQTPLVMMFLNKVGIIDVEVFRNNRRMAWFIMAIFAAVITPTVDAISMLFLWVPMGFLYELGILLCEWQNRNAPRDFDDSMRGEEMVEV
jgi:sec-independent protein translocase protein TatC